MNKVILMIIARLFGAAIGFLVNILIARLLGLEVLGDYSLLLSISSLLSIIIGFGFPSIATIFIARFNANANKQSFDLFITQTSLLIFAASLLLFILVFVTQYGWMQVNFAEASINAFLIANFALATALLHLNSAILVGLQKQFFAMLPELIVKPICFISAFILVFFYYSNVDARLLMIFIIIATYIAVICTYIGLENNIFRIEIANIIGYRPEWMKASFPWILTTIITDFYVEVHIVVMGLLAGSGEIAIIHILFRFRVLVGFALKAINLFFIPKLVEDKAQNNVSAMLHKVKQLNQISFLISLVILIFFYICADLLFGLFNIEYEHAQLALVILAVSLIIKSLMGPASEVLSIHGFQNTTATIMFWTMVISIGLSVIFYDEYSVLAVIIAYAFSSALASIILWAQAKILLDLNCSIFQLKLQKHS